MVRKARDEQVCLQERADKDPLTQLFNRNGYSLRLRSWISIAYLGFMYQWLSS